jgi:hypothetical protein
MSCGLMSINAPEHVLGAIPAEATVEHAVVAKQFLPGNLAAIAFWFIGWATPEVGDGVSHHNNVWIQRGFDLYDLRMALLPVIKVGFQLGCWDYSWVRSGCNCGVCRKNGNKAQQRDGGVEYRFDHDSVFA